MGFTHGGMGGRRTMMMSTMMVSTRATTRGSTALKSLSFSASMGVSGVLRSSPLLAWMCSRVSSAIRNESIPMSATYKLNSIKSIKEQSNAFTKKLKVSSFRAKRRSGS